MRKILGVFILLVLSVGVFANQWSNTSNSVYSHQDGAKIAISEKYRTKTVMVIRVPRILAVKSPIECNARVIVNNNVNAGVYADVNYSETETILEIDSYENIGNFERIVDEMEKGGVITIIADGNVKHEISFRLDGFKQSYDKFKK